MTTSPEALNGTGSVSRAAPLVSICVVNYKTEALTRLCLRGIRRHTHDIPYETIVVDNDSGDASLEYLRSLGWIRLIERPGQVTQSGSWAHAMWSRRQTWHGTSFILRTLPWCSIPNSPYVPRPTASSGKKLAEIFDSPEIRLLAADSSLDL
jgi:hypothetical protein